MNSFGTLCVMSDDRGNLDWTGNAPPKQEYGGIRLMSFGLSRSFEVYIQGFLKGNITGSTSKIIYLRKLIKTTFTR